MKLSIHHDTEYRYEHQVRASIQYLRLTPQSSVRQKILDWQLQLPRPASIQIDPYGNILHILSLDEPHEHIQITAHGLVDIDTECPYETSTSSPLPFLRETRLTQADPALTEFAREYAGQGDRAGLLRLMNALAGHIHYVTGSTRVDTTAAQAFSGRQGVCQDHAHAFVACARSLGIPARYVSGYFHAEAEDHLASHAWAEAWLDGAWYSFDVTNQMGRPERHLKLAVGLDYLDACPVRGMRHGGGNEHLYARVTVAPGHQHQQ